MTVSAGPLRVLPCGSSVQSRETSATCRISHLRQFRDYRRWLARYLTPAVDHDPFAAHMVTGT